MPGSLLFQLCRVKVQVRSDATCWCTSQIVRTLSVFRSCLERKAFGSQCLQQRADTPPSFSSAALLLLLTGDPKGPQTTDVKRCRRVVQLWNLICTCRPRTVVIQQEFMKRYSPTFNHKTKVWLYGWKRLGGPGGTTMHFYHDIHLKHGYLAAQWLLSDSPTCGSPYRSRPHPPSDLDLRLRMVMLVALQGWFHFSVVHSARLCAQPCVWVRTICGQTVASGRKILHAVWVTSHKSPCNAAQHVPVVRKTWDLDQSVKWSWRFECLASTWCEPVMMDLPTMPAVAWGEVLHQVPSDDSAWRTPLCSVDASLGRSPCFVRARLRTKTNQLLQCGQTPRLNDFGALWQPRLGAPPPPTILFLHI